MKLILIALALAALVMPVHAAKEGGGHDGKRKAHPRAAFHRKDKDGNGQLSEQEFTAGAKNEKRAEKRFKKEDADSSGAVSRKEFKGAAGSGAEGKKKAAHHGKGKKKGGDARAARHHGKKHE